MELNGIAHIQLTANDAARSLPFWERLCHFFEMKTLIKNETMVYCIGSRTGVLVREAPPEKRGARFDQNQVGLHHFCFRARAREHVDEVASLRRRASCARRSCTRRRRTASRPATTRCCSRIPTASASR